MVAITLRVMIRPKNCEVVSGQALSTPVLVDLRAELPDLTRLRGAHTRYLRRLRQVNRTWDLDDDESLHGLGMQTRRSIGRVFQCPESVPSIDRLMRGYSILDPACLPPEQASLLTLFVLTSIWEHVKTTR